MKQGHIRIEDALEHAARDAAEHGSAYLGCDSLRAMADAARALREELRKSRTRQHILADALEAAGITAVTVDSDFLPAKPHR